MLRHYHFGMVNAGHTNPRTTPIGRARNDILLDQQNGIAPGSARVAALRRRVVTTAWLIDRA